MPRGRCSCSACVLDTLATGGRGMAELWAHVTLRRRAPAGMCDNYGISVNPGAP